MPTQTKRRQTITADQGTTEPVPQDARPYRDFVRMDAAMTARLKALVEAHELPGLLAVQDAIEQHNKHSAHPAYFALVAYLSAAAFAPILRHAPADALERRRMAAECDTNPRYHRNYALLFRLVYRGCQRRGEVK